MFDEFFKNVLDIFWVFFFLFFLCEVFDQTNAYVAFLNVDLNFFINILLAT